MTKLLSFDLFLNEDDTSYDEDGGSIKITGSVDVDGKSIELKDTLFKIRANKHSILKLLPAEKSEIPSISGIKADDIRKVVGQKLNDPVKLTGMGTSQDNKDIGTITMSVFEISKVGPQLPPKKIVKPQLPPKIDTTKAKEVKTSGGKNEILADIKKALDNGGQMVKLPGKETGTYQIIITGVKV